MWPGLEVYVALHEPARTFCAFLELNDGIDQRIVERRLFEVIDLSVLGQNLKFSLPH